jgi:hypothetical protein
MWSIVQTAVSERGPSSYEELVRFLKQQWRRVTTATITKLARSFKKRLQRQAANGGMAW